MYIKTFLISFIFSFTTRNLLIFYISVCVLIFLNLSLLYYVYIYISLTHIFTLYLYILICFEIKFSLHYYFIELTREDYATFFALVEPGDFPNQRRRRFYCKYCNYSTKIKQHITYHEVKHTGARPFQCAICKRTFTVKSSLRRHLLSHGGKGLD